MKCMVEMTTNIEILYYDKTNCSYVYNVNGIKVSVNRF